MRKLLVWTSYAGVIILLFMNGLKTMFRKNTFSFWFHYFGIGAALLTLLFILPNIFLIIFIMPILTEDSILYHFLSGLYGLYLYLSGVYIAHKLTKYERSLEQH